MVLRKTRELPNFQLLEMGIVILLVIATVVINLRMIRDGINGSVDLKWHATWIQHFTKQLTEGIWYPRWLSSSKNSPRNLEMVFLNGQFGVFNELFSSTDLAS
jgi:hypothetical protein